MQRYISLSFSGSIFSRILKCLNLQKYQTPKLIFSALQFLFCFISDFHLLNLFLVSYPNYDDLEDNIYQLCFDLFLKIVKAIEVINCLSVRYRYFICFTLSSWYICIVKIDNWAPLIHILNLINFKWLLISGK